MYHSVFHFLDPKSVIMTEDYWASPLNPAYVLKSFLMELPDPLLDKDLYEDFIKLSGKVFKEAIQSFSRNFCLLWKSTFGVF